MRYGLLLKALHDHTDDNHEDKDNLAEAIVKVIQVIRGGMMLLRLGLQFQFGIEGSKRKVYAISILCIYSDPRGRHGNQ